VNRSVRFAGGLLGAIAALSVGFGTPSELLAEGEANGDGFRQTAVEYEEKADRARASGDRDTAAITTVSLPSNGTLLSSPTRDAGTKSTGPSTSS